MGTIEIGGAVGNIEILPFGDIPFPPDALGEFPFPGVLGVIIHP